MISIPNTDSAISVLSGCANMRDYIHKPLMVRLSRGLTISSHMYVLVPVNVSYNTSINRWWIFRIGIPHTMWRIHILGS
jgi:hypothetical protein